jgi:hypothetical protein
LLSAITLLTLFAEGTAVNVAVNVPSCALIASLFQEFDTISHVGVVLVTPSAIGAAETDNTPFVPVMVTASVPGMAEAPTFRVTGAVTALAATLALPEHVTSNNVSLQPNATVPVKPFTGVTVTVEVALLPAAADAGGEEATES